MVSLLQSLTPYVLPCSSGHFVLFNYKTALWFRLRTVATFSSMVIKEMALIWKIIRLKISGCHEEMGVATIRGSPVK